MMEDDAHHRKRSGLIGRLQSPALLFMLFVGIGGGGLVSYLWDAKTRLQNEAMIQNARILATSLSDFQAYYTSEILPELEDAGITIAHDFRHVPNALPYPATMIIDYTQFIGRQDSDVSTAMISAYPFTWRANRLLTEFDRRALEAVTTTRSEFAEFIAENGHRNLRFAAPIIMSESCVACHNTHPASTRTDWEVGDVRGAHVIELPETQLAAGMQLEFSYLLILIGAAAALSGVAIAMLRHREKLALAGLEARNVDLLRANYEKDLANQTKNEFLANISHEVRTPMNGILGLVDLMLQDAKRPQDTANLKRMQMAGQSLLHVINDVLDFSKIEADSMQFENIAFDLEMLISDVAGLFSYADAAPGRPKMFVDLDPSLPAQLYGDPFRITQVLTNLLSNAFKFTQTGHVSLTVQRASDDPDQLCLAVSDTGPGIAPDAQAKLFEPFTQADGTVSRRFGGTGLGLSISLRLAAGMGGTLDLYSELGHGATFTLRLPLRPKDQSGPISKAPQGVTHVHILDDEPARAEILRRMLQHMGLEGAELESLESARAMLDQPAGRVPQMGTVILLSLDEDNCEAYLSYAEENAGRHLLTLLPPTTPVFSGVEALRPPVLPGALMQALEKVVASTMAADASTAAVDEGAENRPHTASDELAGLRVLVVDDNELNLIIAAAFLEKSGARQFTASSGREAVQAVRENIFDIILMDIQMPEMDGYEAAGKIHAFAPDIPIIALTANVQPQDKQRSADAGFVAHLTKPLGREALCRELARFKTSAPQGVPPRPASALDPIPVPEEPADLISVLEGMGVDTATGISNMGDDRQLYRQILDSFTGPDGDLVPSLQAGLANGEDVEAIRAVHTMKSLLSLISAHAAADQADLIEAAFRASGPRASDAVEELIAHYDAIRNAIAANLD